MTKKKNFYLIFAGVINLFTSLLHTIGGQIELVDPLLKSHLSTQIKAEWLAVWHMITILLFITSFIILKRAIKPSEGKNKDLLKFIGFLYILFSIPFIISSFIHNVLAAQWILLLPIGILLLFGIKREKL